MMLATAPVFPLAPGFQPLSRLIRLAISSKSLLWLPHSDNSGVLVDGVQAVFHELGKSCESICTTGVEMRKVRWHKGTELQFEDSQGRPLQHLRWHAAFCEFNGVMPAHLRRDDIISVNQQPDFSYLPHEPEFYKIADMLCRRPTSPAFAARLLRVSEESVNHFYYTAWHAGMIEHVNRKDYQAEMMQQYLQQERGLARNIATLLKTDVRNVWHSEARVLAARQLVDILNTDVMDILTADLLAPFKAQGPSE